MSGWGLVVAIADTAGVIFTSVALLLTIRAHRKRCASRGRSR